MVLNYVTGHCYDSISGQPPRGLQFILGTNTTQDMVDTIVMANLVRLHLLTFQPHILYIHEIMSCDILGSYQFPSLCVFTLPDQSPCNE